MVKSTRVIGVVCILLGFACGGSDGDKPVETGLPKEAKLSSLDESEAKQVCESLADGFNGMVSDSDRKRIDCTVLALPQSVAVKPDGSFTGDVAKCQGLVARCMNGEKISDQAPLFELPTEFVDESSCKDSRAQENIAGCEATVGELESCADSLVSAFESQFALMDCESLSDPEKLTQGGDFDPEALPECESFTAKCPNVDFGASVEIEESSSEG